MATTVLDLHEIDSISSEDLLHIIDVTRSNEDSKVDISTLTTYLNTALDIPQTIASVNGLQAALDGKSNVGHTHTIEQIVGLSSELDSKLNSNQANIAGRIINIKGVAITVPEEITGVRDDRIPENVIIGDYLQFDAADGGIQAITDNTLKNNLQIDLIDNTSDANKPVSTATQTALDEKNSVNAFTEGQAAQDVVIAANTARAAEIAINTAKNSYPTVDATKLASIEFGADVTDTENVWGSLGISGSGSTGQFLTQRGVFVNAPSITVNKSQIDAAIGANPNGNTTLFYNQAGAFTAPEGGDEVTKQAIDNAIGVFPTGDSAQFYNEQGNFIDAVYDSVEDAPIIRNRTIETIVLSGTRSNVQARLTGVSEMSVITMQNTFDSSPTQYTTTFTSPNTTFTPALVFPAGSQGRQLSLTEADGTLHRFCYLVNGNYRLLAGGLTGTVRLGPIAVATTATVTAAVTVPDQTAGQTITLAGDETGTFSVGDFISPQANNFGAYRGIFVDSITFDGTNTVIVGPSNGATTFNTTSVLRNAGPATEIQGTIPTFSGDPDTANTVYSSSIPATEFTVLGVNTSAHLIQVANAFAALETEITTDGVVTDNGDGTSSITVNYNTETNIDSSFTITGGLNNMESIVNVDGMIGDLSPATTITVIDPEATEVVSFTSSAADTSTENVDDIAAQIVLAVNNNVETPINFDAEYDLTTKTIILTAERAGNTNPWTIIFDNNGVTNENAGNLGYILSQTGEIINQIDTISIVNPIPTTTIFSSTLDGSIQVGSSILYQNDTDTGVYFSTGILEMVSSDVSLLRLEGGNEVIVNTSGNDVDFIIKKETSGDALVYDAGTDTLTVDAATTVIGFGGGADGLSITDTVNLNLLEGTTVLSTVVLPSSSGTTVIVGTTDEIINTVSGDTNTLSLAPAITDAITANTAKVGITTAQSDAITSNTGKTGITVEQSNAIIANTAKVSNVDILPLANTFTEVNTFSNTGGIQTNRVVGFGDIDTYIDIAGIQDNVIICYGSGIEVFSTSNTIVAVNPLRNGSVDFVVRKQTTGDALFYDESADTFTISSDVLTINSTTINGLPSKADALSISGQVLSLLDGTTSLSTVTLPSGGTATTVQGTSGQIGVNTVGNTATVSLDTAITGAITANTAKIGISTAQASAITANTAKVGITTAQATAITNNTAKTGITTAQSDAITANTAKVSVAGLNQVGAAVLSTDSVVYYAGTALAPRRKTFSLVPLSIMNNDSGFITGITKANVDTAIGTGGATTDYYASDKTWKSIPSGGTATTVLGTTGEIDVATVGNNATVSISSTITDAIDLNTAKQSVAGLTQVGGAIIASDSLLYYDGTVPRRKVFSSVPLSVMNNDSGFTTNTGTVTSVTGTANEVDVATGTTTPVVSLNNTITSAITANTSKVGITTAQASAIVANTAKVSNVNILPLNNDFTGIQTFSNAAGIQVENIVGANEMHLTANSNEFLTYDSSLGVVALQTNATNTIINSTGATAFRLNGVNEVSVISGGVVINSSNLDKDFSVNKQTSGRAIYYDAGTDTLSSEATNYSGIAEKETGSWTPTWNNVGTVGTATTTYSRVGQTVIGKIESNVTSSTSTSAIFISTSSLPYNISTAENTLANGTWFTTGLVFGTPNVTSATDSGVIVAAANNLYFMKSDGSLLLGTEIAGYIGLTITYTTT